MDLILLKNTFMSYSALTHRQSNGIKDIDGHPIYKLADLKTCVFCENKNHCEKLEYLSNQYFIAMMSLTDAFYNNVKKIYYCKQWRLSDKYKTLPGIKSQTKTSSKSDFFNSLDWKRIRVKVLEQQGGACQCCGRTHKEHGIILHVDHIVPISKDWSRRLDINNLQVLCAECNIGKGNQYITDWRKAGIIDRRG